MKTLIELQLYTWHRKMQKGQPTISKCSENQLLVTAKTLWLHVNVSLLIKRPTPPTFQICVLVKGHISEADLLAGQGPAGVLLLGKPWGPQQRGQQEWSHWTSVFSFPLIFFFNFIYLFIYGCVGSSFLCEGFL